MSENTHDSSSSIKAAVRAAFIASIPVLMGYFTMGFAFGVLLAQQVPGADVWLASVMCLTMFSGSMQFAAVEMLKNAASYSLLLTAMMVLLINIRYALYGLPMLGVFRQYPWYLRWFLIMGLTDESYAIVSSCPYAGEQQKYYITSVELLDCSYWIVGGTMGAMLGNKLFFNTDGIEFAMLALFVVILVDLCRDRQNWKPAAVGSVVTGITMILAMTCCPSAANKMLLPAMAVIVAAILKMRPRTSASTQEERS